MHRRKLSLFAFYPDFFLVQGGKVRGEGIVPAGGSITSLAPSTPWIAGGAIRPAPQRKFVSEGSGEGENLGWWLRVQGRDAASLCQLGIASSAVLGLVD